MPSQDLNRAIQLARAGDKKSARQILLRLVEEEPANEMAWIWLADTMPDDARRIATLKQCLKMIPQSQLARKALQVLLEQGKMPPAAEGRTTPPSPVAAQVPESPASPPLFSVQDDLLSLREEVILPAEEQPEVGPFLTEETEEAAPLVPDQKSPPLQWPAAGQKPVEPYVDNEAIEQLRRQAGKAGSSPAVKMAEATQVVGKKVNPVRWGAIFLVVVLAVVVGMVVFTLWFSPNSPYRLSLLQPLPTQLSGYQPPQETPVIETPIEVTPLITEEVETTEEVEETVESTPPPPGIYLSGSQVNSFDWSPDDTFVAVSASGGLSVYEPQNFGTLRYIDLTGSYAVCRISPIVDRVVCAGSMLWAWTLPDWNLEISTPPPGGLPGSRIGLFQFVSQFIFGQQGVYQFWADNFVPIFLGKNFGEAVLNNPSWLVNISGKTYLRSLAFFPDPHMFSFYLGLITPLALGQIITAKRKSFWVVVFLLIFITNLLTFSRGGYVGIFLGILVMIIIFWKKFDARYQLVSLLLASFLFLALIIPTQFSKRFYSSFDLSEGSNQGRLEAWNKSWIIIRNNPLIGVGLGNYPLEIKANADYREPIYSHNAYLDIAAETGILNLLNWIIFIVFSCAALLKKTKESIFFTLSAISLLIFSIHSLVETGLFSTSVMALFLTIASFANLEFEHEESN